ncbi:hypothetical protein [Mesorhizobium sp. 2RAF21]
MDQIGTYVIYVIMFCAVLGALAAIRNDQDGLGKVNRAGFARGRLV